MPQTNYPKLKLGSYPSSNFILIHEAMLRLDMYTTMWNSHTTQMPDDWFVVNPSRRTGTKGVIWQKGTWVHWLNACKYLMTKFTFDKRKSAAVVLRDIGLNEMGLADQWEVLRFKTKDWDALKDLRKKSTAKIISDTRAVQKKLPPLSELGIGTWTVTATGAWYTGTGRPLEATPRNQALERDMGAQEPKNETKRKPIEAKDIPEKYEDVDMVDELMVSAWLNRNKLEQEDMKTRRAKIELAKISNAVIEIEDVEKLLQSSMTALRSTMDQSVDKQAADVVAMILTTIFVKFPKFQRDLNNLISVAEVAARIRADSHKALRELAEVLEAFARSVDPYPDEVDQE